MKFSKSLPMGNDEVDKYIEDIVERGNLKLIEPERFPYFETVKLLYLGAQGFITIDKHPKDGKWEVTIET